MKITKKRRDELKSKPKKVVTVVPNPSVMGSMFPTKIVDNSEIFSRLDEIKDEVSKKPLPVTVTEDKTTATSNHEALVKLMDENTNKIIDAINNRKVQSMEIVPERQGGIIQRVIIKPYK